MFCSLDYCCYSPLVLCNEEKQKAAVGCGVVVVVVVVWCRSTCCDAPCEGNDEDNDSWAMCLHEVLTSAFMPGAEALDPAEKACAWQVLKAPPRNPAFLEESKSHGWPSFRDEEGALSGLGFKCVRAFVLWCVQRFKAASQCLSVSPRPQAATHETQHDYEDPAPPCRQTVLLRRRIFRFKRCSFQVLASESRIFRNGLRLHVPRPTQRHP